MPPTACSPAKSAGPESLTAGAMTFDVEEWFHAENLKIPRSRWHAFPCRLDGPIDTILGLLDRHDTRATFFVLGWIASRWSGIVERIRAAGHEIASHGYGHKPISQLNRAEFRDDLRASKEVLEDTIGERVIGYRAPSYSIDSEEHWALDELVAAGFEYDSSIYPVRAPHGRYGVAGASLAPYRIRAELWEFPLPTVGLAGCRLPAATGAYLRLWPFSVTRHAIGQNLRRRIPVVVNIHPWELDPQQPRWPASRYRRSLHYTNLRTTGSKLARMLAIYRFVPLRDLKVCWEQRETTRLWAGGSGGRQDITHDDSAAADRAEHAAKALQLSR